MKIFVLMMLISALSVFAEDIETLKHQVYKNATISRTEPDGIVVMHDAGIVKIPFTELSEEYKKRFRFDEKTAEQFRKEDAARQQAIQIKARQETERVAESRRKEFINAEKDRAHGKAFRQAEQFLSAIEIHAYVRPFIFKQDSTTAWIQPVTQTQTGTHNQGLDVVPTLAWIPDGEKFIGVIDESMPQFYERGDEVAVVLYKIGHTQDSTRNPLFTERKERALGIIAAGGPND